MPDMPLNSTATYNRFIETAPVIISGYGESVREYKPESQTYPTPTALSLIYITLGYVEDPTENQDKLEFIVRHMYMDKYTDLDKAEQTLFDIAKAGQPHSYWVGKDFIDLKWSEPCFVTVVLDCHNHEFYWNIQPGHDPIVFVQQRIIDNGRPHPPEPYSKNYSFYNAIPRLIRGRSAVRCVNFLKADQAGTDLKKGESQYFCIHFNMLVTYASGVKHGHIIDPDGQNQGPDGV